MIKLSGILEYSMGGFLCLRGFGSFKLLSHASVPNPDVQRSLIEKHKSEIAEFLIVGEYRFFPEVILSLNLSDGKENLDTIESFYENISAGNTWNKSIGDIQFHMSQNITKNISFIRGTQITKINIAHIRFDETAHKLTRIDGNHRLSVADQVVEDFTIPYCLLLFRYPQENDQYSRAIFHNINAKQIPLNLEENIKVILDSTNVFSDDKLIADNSFGWKYYLARKTIESLDFEYFPAISSYIASAKYSFFVELYGFLLESHSIEEKNESIQIIKSQLHVIEKALVESEIIATTTNIAVIGALAFYRLTDDFKYRGFLSWIKKNNIGNVEKLHIEDVINLYNEIYEHVPKKAFLARWYPSEEHDGKEEAERANCRLLAMKEVAEELDLELTDLGTCTTGTFDIRERMYTNIEECDIFIADVSGARHNVMIEIGYALKHVDTGRMVFYFQKSTTCNSVPFDVNHLAYDEIVDSAEIKTKTKARIQTILEQARSGEI